MSFYKPVWVYPAEVSFSGDLPLVEMGAGPAASLACEAAALEKDFLI